MTKVNRHKAKWFTGPKGRMWKNSLKQVRYSVSEELQAWFWWVESKQGVKTKIRTQSSTPLSSCSSFQNFIQSLLWCRWLSKNLLICHYFNHVKTNREDNVMDVPILMHINFSPPISLFLPQKSNEFGWTLIGIFPLPISHWFHF